MLMLAVACTWQRRPDMPAPMNSLGNLARLNEGQGALFSDLLNGTPVLADWPEIRQAKLVTVIRPKAV